MNQPCANPTICSHNHIVFPCEVCKNKVCIKCYESHPNVCAVNRRKRDQSAAFYKLMTKT